MKPVLKKSSKSNARKKNRLDMNISSGPERKVMFGCEICGKILANKTTLAQHIKIHEGKKPFRCDICDYSCSQKGNMKTHVASVHVVKKPFKCDICDYSFSLKNIMKRHIITVHGGKKPSQKGSMKTHVAPVHEEMV